MSGAEVAHRLAPACARSRQNFASLEAPAADLNARDLRFLPPFIAPAPEALTAAAERILAGRYSFFDLEDCELGDPPQWNRDPLTQRSADVRRASSIDYRDERVVGNIKYLWEPNRHLHLPVLAQAHALTGDVRYSLSIQRQIDSWIDQCPVGRGPNWVSPLELGIRLINWSLSWQLLGGMRAKIFTGPEGEQFRDRWLRSIYQHVRMVVTNLSAFSSANNHLIGEAAGVYVAASTWPLWPQMGEWGERCRGILEEECLRQNCADGGNREQAFAYQTFVLDFLLLSGLAARARGEDFSPLYWRRVETMIDFLASFTDVAGRLPMIGDADDGLVVRLASEPGFSTHVSLIATGAVLFNRADLAAKAGTLDGKTATLLGVEAVRRLAHLKCAAARFRPRQQFAESGYYLLGAVRHTRRGSPVADADRWLSQHAAHGHADAEFRSQHRVTRDPGRSGHLLVSHRPRMATLLPFDVAHNTVASTAWISRCRAATSLESHAAARCIEFDGGGDVQRFVGEHDGTAPRDPWCIARDHAG